MLHYHGGPQQIGPTVHTKTYIFTYFYQQYLVSFTMVPRDKEAARFLETFTAVDLVGHMFAKSIFGGHCGCEAAV